MALPTSLRSGSTSGVGSVSWWARGRQTSWFGAPVRLTCVMHGEQLEDKEDPVSSWSTEMTGGHPPRVLWPECGILPVFGQRGLGDPAGGPCSSRVASSPPPTRLAGPHGTPWARRLSTGQPSPGRTRPSASWCPSWAPTWMPGQHPASWRHCISPLRFVSPGRPSLCGMSRL